MLGALEDAVRARLETLKVQVPRLTLGTYGGELGDPDLLAELVKNTPSVLITTPKVSFRLRSNRRYAAAVVFRLIVASGAVREPDRRRGTVVDPGSYWLWEACLRLLTGWQHRADGASVKPTEFANLVNGKYQAQHLSVLGQGFAIELDWTIPEEPMPDLEGIDLSYHVPADNDVAVATDTINLEIP
ncbi:phage protein Gp37 [Stutzerimonas kirkiae]|uniref:phage protein Gp37 n=1 Tax=Stutzerimonas kirkiae TaxID=2211392 RepID=UPI00103858E1|nr:phage protein Gp37 [Stutzerimonas kirkiae]TBV12757.1 hypothetical protein DNK01_13810 [Stutzerimonas kirkiae]